MGDEGTAGVEAHDLAIALELPGRRDAAREAVADAGMVEAQMAMLDSER